jgi:hypothetical protein
MDEFTDDEKQQMRSGAFGAVMLVSRADPGAMDMIRESFAASKSLAQAPAGMQAILKGMPKVPQGDAAQVESGVLADLSSSAGMLATKDPAQLAAYRKAVLDACTSAAQAAGGGVDSAESMALTKVMSALGMS